jgi:homocysteine S-methyltransferase
MGTELLRRGYPQEVPLELANLTHPELVERIHRDYLSAGAKLLETNTFGANTIKLAASGYERQVAEIIRAGVNIARKVGREQAYVLGSIGPLGKPVGDGFGVRDEEARESYRIQLETFLECGVDALLLETMPSIREVELALEVLSTLSANVPYIVQFSFLPDGSTPYGEGLNRVVEFLKDIDACAVGINCGSGPRDAVRIISYFAEHLPGPFSVQPNAGYPQVVQGRLFYGASPEYFASFARDFVTLGVKILGGCCGTTPAHIEALAKAVHEKGAEPTIEVFELQEEPGEETALPPSTLAEKLGNQFVVTVEITPPKGIDLERVKEGVNFLKQAGVDAVNISDSPMARVRISPIALAHLLKEELGMESIVHFTCRDRNFISLQSELLGAAALGIQNILALTGDPPSIGDHPFARPVFDVNSEGLVQILSKLNSGVDFAGNPLGRATSFTIGVALNPGAADLDREIERLRRKIEYGAHFILTQPIYDVQDLERFLERFAGPLPPILGGILPLRSFRHAEFLHNEVPGITIPEQFRKRMAEAQNPKEEGIAIACEVIARIQKMVAGIYLMPPFEKYDMAVEIIGRLPKECRRG